MYICFSVIFPFLFLSLHCKQNTEPTSLFLFSCDEIDSLYMLYFLLTTYFFTKLASILQLSNKRG